MIGSTRYSWEVRFFFAKNSLSEYPLGAMKTWNLKNLYPNEELFHKDWKKGKKSIEQKGSLAERLLSLQEAGAILRQLDSYAECLVAENPANPDAHGKSAEVAKLKGLFEKGEGQICFELAALPEEAFTKLLNTPKLSPLAFYLEEGRQRGKLLSNPESEELLAALSADGYHGLFSLYQTMVSKVKIGPNKLSVGQAINLHSDPDRAVREKAFAEWTEGWKGYSDLAAQILNHIGSIRLAIYEKRKWEDPLFEPLLLNRMEQKSFDAMWKAVEGAKPVFVKYLERKAKLLGLKQLSWCDVGAPLNKGEEIPYEKAAQQIGQEFQTVHPGMAAFAKRVFQSGWIEAEDRAGKAPGGFCVALPLTKESRIFMTYKGTSFNVATLAHELGHAYHNECLKELPFFCQEPRMNVAETASTFAETLVIDQQIAKAKSKEEKRALLDDKLERCIAYFMNLHARYLFEKRFYEERKEGYLSEERLCTLMTEAQKEAYCNCLSSWDPYFWASKLHFFYTHFPFYNFPYTFGYLLSNGLLDRIKKGAKSTLFDTFLADTGRMRVEDLCQKHLGVDLRKSTFWEEALAPLIADAEAFLAL